MSEKDDFAKGIITGALIGGLAGVVVGILIAPKSGSETRQEIAEKAKDFADKVQDEYDVLYDKARRSTDTLIHRLHEMEEAARRKADELAGKLKSPAQG
jgi:gas vesicle protein